MRVPLTGWLWLALPLLALAQQPAFRSHFQTLLRQHKTKEAQAVVTQWGKAAPHDPDLYVARFNLLLTDADALLLSADPNASGEGFQISDPKTGKEVGSIRGGGYNPLKVQQAIAELRQGLAYAPDRLDMRFGMAYAAKLVDDAPQQLQLVKEALVWRASSAGRPWRWRDGEPLPAPEAQFVPGTVETYMVPYWQSGTQAGYQQALALAELLLTYYPASSLGYFNKGNYYASTGNDAEAYKWFRQADQRNPHDPQLLNNLLRMSLNLHDKPAARGYLERLRKYPDFADECHRFAAELVKP